MRFERETLLRKGTNMAVTTRLVRRNQTQDLQLPKDVAFPDDVTEIIVVGTSRVICPVGQRWDSYFARTTKVSDDFIAQRDQGEFEDREPL